MKKTGLLLLLVPTLFLASCQTTPKIDTIDEKEARAFIEEHFKKEEFEAPKATSKIKWEIKSTNEDTKNQIKGLISKYIYSDGRSITDDKNTGGLLMSEDSTRLNNYLTELDGTPESFGNTGTDAVIGMNTKIFNNLYKSGQNDVHPFALVYKQPGKNLTIISQSTNLTTLYTRTHYYNEFGQETKFEVNVNKDDGAYVYTMSIEFKY